MNFKERVRWTIETKNAKWAGKIAEFLRFDRGMNCEESHEYINEIYPITKEDWDDFMIEAERIDSRG
jgi:hypothetical protein